MKWLSVWRLIKMIPYSPDFGRSYMCEWMNKICSCICISIERNLDVTVIDWSPRPTHGSDHYFYTSVLPSVRSHFSKSRQTKPFSSKNSDRYCGSGRVDHRGAAFVRYNFWAKLTRLSDKLESFFWCIFFDKIEVFLQLNNLSTSLANLKWPTGPSGMVSH